MSVPIFERRSVQRSVAPRLVRMKDVTAMCGLSRASIYKFVSEGTFPTPVKIGGRASAWVKQEVEDWIAERMRERTANKT